MIIAFEGPAFSGKTSVINILVEEGWGKKVPEILISKNFLSFSACMENDLKKYLFAQNLNKFNNFVFMDRSYISTGVYVQLARKFGYFDKVSDYYSGIAVQKEKSLLKPDICFLFQIKKHIGLLRGCNEIRYDASLIWYRNIALTYKLYNSLLKDENIKTICIDANCDISSILVQIKYYLNLYISKE